MLNQKNKKKKIFIFFVFLLPNSNIKKLPNLENFLFFSFDKTKFQCCSKMLISIFLIFNLIGLFNLEISMENYWTAPFIEDEEVNNNLICGNNRET